MGGLKNEGTTVVPMCKIGHNLSNPWREITHTQEIRMHKCTDTGTLVCRTALQKCITKHITNKHIHITSMQICAFVTVIFQNKRLKKEIPKKEYKLQHLHINCILFYFIYIFKILSYLAFFTFYFIFLMFYHVIHIIAIQF